MTSQPLLSEEFAVIKFKLYYEIEKCEFYLDNFISLSKRRSNYILIKMIPVIFVCYEQKEIQEKQRTHEFSNILQSFIFWIL